MDSETKSIGILGLLFFFGIMVMGFFYWPFGILSHEVAKVNFFILFVSALYLVSLLRMDSISRRPISKSLFIDTLVLFLTLLLASIIGVDFYKSIIGNYFRHDGLITFAFYIFFSVWVAIFWQDSFKLYFPLAVVSGQVLASLFVIYSWFSYSFLNNKLVIIWPDGGVGGSFGNPVFFAGFIIVAIPFLVYFFKNYSTYRLFVLLIAGIEILALYLTKSRTALLGPMIVFLLYLFIGRSRKFQLLTIISAIVLLLFSVPKYIENTRIRYMTPVNYVAESRPRIFMKLLMSVEKRPIFGWGWANIDYAFDSSDWPSRIEKNDVYLDKAHSSILEIVVASGLFGLAIYLTLIILVLRSLFAGLKSVKSQTCSWEGTILVVFLAILIHSQTNIISVSEELLFWAIVGIANIKPNAKSPRSSNR